MTRSRRLWLGGLIVAVLGGVESVRYINFARAGLIGTTYGYRAPSPVTTYVLVLLACALGAAVCLVGFLATFRRQPPRFRER